MIQIGYKYKIVPSFFWQVLCKRCNPYYEIEKGKVLLLKVEVWIVLLKWFCLGAANCMLSEALLSILEGEVAGHE